MKVRLHQLQGQSLILRRLRWDHTYEVKTIIEAIDEEYHEATLSPAQGLDERDARYEDRSCRTANTK